MHHGDNPQGFFIRRVGYQIVPDSNEAQRTGGKVWACVASIWKCNKAANSGVDFFKHTSSSKRVIGCDIFPDLRDILGCERMKDKTLVTAHLDERSFNKSSSRVPWWPYPAFRQRITRPGYCTLGFPNESVRTAPWKPLSGLPTTGIAGPRSFTIGQRTRLH